MMKKLRILLGAVFFLLAAIAQANEAVFELTVDKPVDAVYKGVYEALEEARFFVVFEPDIGSNLSRFADKWDDYNQNNLTALRSMVFCNGWYANKVSNLDTSMLGMCPLHLSVYEKDGKTTVVFNRPTVIARQSPALPVFQRIEQEVIEAIRSGVGE